MLAVVVFLMLGSSAPLWAALPLARLAQFPWRLLSLTTVAMAVLSGAVVLRERPVGRGPAPATLVLTSLLVLSSLPYLRVSMSEDRVDLANLMRFEQSSDEMTGSTAWVRSIPRWSPMADFFIAGEAVTSKVNYGYLYRQAGTVHARTLELRAQSERVEFYADRPALLTFDTFYYPGWKAYLLHAETGEVLDDLPIALRGELGLMTVRVPAGVHHVLLRLEDTPVRKLSTAVTFASLLFVLLLLVVRWRLGPRQRTGRG
jgi:hypothetical protein